MSVLRAWKALEEDLLSAKEFLGVALSWAAWQKNALYEALLDKKAPGATSQAVQGHDHVAAVDGGQGGRIVGRSMAAMGGAGNNGFAEVEITALNTSTWVTVPVNYATNGIPSFRAWCGKGMISATGTAPSAPCLDAKVLVFSDLTVDVRIQHATTSFYSATKTHTPSGSFLSSLLHITNIPANDEGWNPYNLQVRSSGLGSYIYICLVNESESPIVDGTYYAGTPPTPTQQIGS
jgi:hypothetical protein